MATLTAWARKYGDVVHYRFFGLPVYFLVHPEHIEQVLLTRAGGMSKGMISRSNPELFGNGLLTSDGDFWRRQRRLSNPAFHRENIVRYSEIATQEAARLLDDWKTGETRNIHDDMMNVTLRIVLRSLFGSDFFGGAKVIEKALDAIMRGSAGIQAVAAILHIPTLARRRYFRAVSELDGVVYEIIARGRQKLKHGAEGASSDLLTLLLSAQDDDGSTRNDQQLRDEVLGGRWPSPSDLPKLSFTDKVIREAMRLYPPAWRIGRTTSEPLEIANYVLPAAANIVLSQWVTHRDPRWFPDPERFSPDRWEEKSASQLPRFAFFPFGGGPRVCIGAGFAMMEATLLLASIGQRYKLRLVPDQQIEPLPSITLRPKNGIRVQLQERQASRVVAASH